LIRNVYEKRSLLIRLSDVAESISSSRRDEDTGESIFTPAEREYCGRRLGCLGARYIIKKCIADYLSDQNGCRTADYQGIEITNNGLGQPFLRLSPEIRERMDDLKIKDISISISHSRHWIAGMVLFGYEGTKPQ
jgi:phosphopantetheinyl transferase (holo-ACP synthase)